MKKIFAILITLSLLLSSCSIDWNDEKDKKISELEKQIQNDNFKRKQECSKHKDKIENNIKTDITS
jgi:outer membrane lipoprotein-sorting protein